MSNKYLFFFLAFLLGCAQKGEQTLFTLIPSGSSGINFTNHLVETDSFNMIEYLYFNDGGGVAAGDINNDGLTDLYFTSNQEKNRLFLNKGNFKFEDITETAGVAGEGDWKTGVTMADINGDGFLDIYISCLGDYKGKHGHNQLFINHGDLTFTDQSKALGLDFVGYSVQSAFFDFDLDGDLDMYLVNSSIHSEKTYGNASLRNEFDNYAGDRLFRNDVGPAKQVFTDISKPSGIYSSQIGYGLAVSIADITGDGYPDIFISNDFHENDYLYVNNRNGTFTERLTQMLAHTSRSSMGNDIADFNNDGLPDILVLDMLPEDESIRKRSAGEDDYDLYQLKLNYGYYYQFVRNTLQLNIGNNKFSEIGRLAGVYSTDWSWSPLFCDLDNDGWKDIYITNGIYRRANDLDYINYLANEPMAKSWKNTNIYPDKFLYEKMPLDPLVNYAYKNNRDLTFTNMAGDWGIDKKSYSNGSCYADLDNDGDLDLIINNINAEAFVYRNNAERTLKNHYLAIRFKGGQGNPFGIGARVSIFINDTIQVAENFNTRGFQSSVAPCVHFGLGNASRVDSVIVTWPGGSIQKLRNVNADQWITADILNAHPVNTGINVQDRMKTVLNQVINIPGLQFVHKENSYPELNTDILLPHSLSAEGPCIAVGDANHDGRDDIFIGGAKGQIPVLFLQEPSGFIEARQNAFWEATIYEDVDAIFFDADNDEDQDLYVVSGGNESTGQDQSLRDRLYINDGSGNFNYAKENIPVFFHNGSCVRPCDLDMDGDLDLFVGSRSVPKSYGSTPESYLLENDGGGIFSDITLARAQSLGNVGMVTDGVWADYDTDGDPDLAVSGEWMPVRVFRNDHGNLTEDKSKNGLDKSGGWWFSIIASDIDRDGDPDLIGGNLGLNAMITANEKEPAAIYINDFDNNGTLDPIISYFRQGRNYPASPVNDLIRQIVSLQKKYPNYTEFAGKTMDEIFGTDKLGKSLVKKVYNFQSSIFINNGKGSFTVKPLPVEVQFSPVMDILAEDFDMDSIPDLLLGGNYYSVKPFMGRYDASFGWFLKGNGRGDFKVEYPAESGWYIRGEIRDLNSFRFNNDQFIIAGLNNEEIKIFVENPHRIDTVKSGIK